jgi:hypothetical protein
VSIVESNQRLGLLSWARDASPFIIVYGEDAAVVPIALELAELMDAIFTDDVSELGLD